MIQTRRLARSAPAGRVIRLFAHISSLVLIVMMGVTFAGVVMRYLIGAPILGANEIVEHLSVALVMLAMPYAAQTGAHIRVDVFDRAIGRYGRFLGDVVSRCAAIYVLGILAYRAWWKLLDAAEFGDATNMLRIPLWPSYGLIVLGIALYVVVLVLQVASIALTGSDENE